MLAGFLGTAVARLQTRGDFVEVKGMKTPGDRQNQTAIGREGHTVRSFLSAAFSLQEKKITQCVCCCEGNASL